MAIFDNLFGAPPEYLTGLLGADETDKLRKQALTTGLVNSAIALIAQPRNQRYGSALPYIGKALMAGQQAGQNVYSNALQGFETQQKLAELKRQQEQRAAQEDYINTLPENVRATLRANPTLIPKYAETSVIPKERKYEKVGDQLVDVTEKPTVAYTASQQPAYKPGQTRDFIQGTQRVTQEYQPDGTWKTLATGNAFAPPSSNIVNVSTKGEGKYQETLGTKLAERDVGVIESGQSAPKQYESAQRIKTLLTKNPITGVGAEQITQLNNLLSSSGLIDPSRGATTEVLASSLADTTLQYIKSSGLGAGAGFSNTDRQFLERAKAGQISMTAESLKQLADLNERAALASMEKYNSLVDRLPAENKSYYGLTPVQIPSSTPRGRLR